MNITTPNDPDFKVDWGAAPRRCTHVAAFGFSEFSSGRPLYPGMWEKWVPHFRKGKATGEYLIFEWNGTVWVQYSSTFSREVFPNTRLRRPGVEDRSHLYLRVQ